jgi:hypothetical protein
VFYRHIQSYFIKVVIVYLSRFVYFIFKNKSEVYRLSVLSDDPCHQEVVMIDDEKEPCTCPLTLRSVLMHMCTLARIGGTRVL